MAVRIQLRHDTKENWEKVNPILLKGEIGIELDNEGKLKIGKDKNWNDTAYFDMNFIHAYSEEDIKLPENQDPEEIYGKKIFYSRIDFNNYVDFYNNIKVHGSIEGIADQAIKDEYGENIRQYYQKRLDTYDEVTEDEDWNKLVEEGYHFVCPTYWNTSYSTTEPCKFNENLIKTGILKVSKVQSNPANGGTYHILQIYFPIKELDSEANGLSTIVYRTRNNSGWSDWKSMMSDDITLVHIDNDEVINGTKTFEQPIIANAGSIILKGDEVTFKDESDKVFIRKESNSTLTLKGEGEIRLTTSEDLDDDNNIIISNGVLSGKCTQDSNGNNIVNTYATKDELRYSSQSLQAPQYIKITDNQEGYTELLNRFHAVCSDSTQFLDNATVDNIKTPNYVKHGAVVIKKDSKATNFTSADDYIESPITATALHDVANWSISVSFETGELIETAQAIIGGETTNVLPTIGINGDNLEVGIPVDNNVITYNELELTANATYYLTLTYAQNNFTLNGNCSYLEEREVAVLDDTGAPMYTDKEGHTLTKTEKDGNTIYTYTNDSGEEITVSNNNLVALTKLSQIRVSEDIEEVIATNSINIAESDVKLVYGKNGSTSNKSAIILNECTVELNNQLAYQPCLMIPYIKTLEGIKITIADMENSIDSCYNQFKTGNYFILDEETQQFRAPYISSTGLNYVLNSIDNDDKTCEYDTNLNCTQTGSCNANETVTFLKPFANTNYKVSIPYSAKTVNGFTSTQAGDYIAKGKITLG